MSPYEPPQQAGLDRDPMGLVRVPLGELPMKMVPLSWLSGAGCTGGTLSKACAISRLSLSFLTTKGKDWTRKANLH